MSHYCKQLARKTGLCLLTALTAAALMIPLWSTAAYQQPVIREITVTVKGMVCSSCSSAVENVLKELNGVEKARADVKKDRVRVWYDMNKVSPQLMVEAIRKLGYQAILPAEPALH